MEAGVTGSPRNGHQRNCTNLRGHWREAKMQANARSDKGNRRRKRKQIVEIMENEEKLRNEGMCRKLTWNGRRTVAGCVASACKSGHPQAKAR